MGDPTPSRIPNKDLYVRIGSAIVLGIPALIVGWFGGVIFLIAMVGLGALALQEWFRVTELSGWLWIRIMSIAVLLPITFAFASDFPLIGLLFTFLICLFWVPAGKSQAKWAIAGLLYVAIPTVSLVAIRGGSSESFVPILFLFLVVWATDILAFFGGRALGGPKLWPRISPGKTWTGAVSGLVGSLVVAFMLWSLLESVPIISMLIVAASLSVAAQCGDLLESALKRHFKIKDSGNLIPGHGGVLDRVDGLYGAAAVAFVLVVVGLGGPLSL